jgi:hypothetical protein
MEPLSRRGRKSSVKIAEKHAPRKYTVIGKFLRTAHNGALDCGFLYHVEVPPNAKDLTVEILGNAVLDRLNNGKYTERFTLGDIEVITAIPGHHKSALTDRPIYENE